MKCSFLNLYVNNMAVFDRIRLLRLKKYLLCTPLILKRITFAKQRKERKCWVRKINLDRPEKEEYQLLVKDYQEYQLLAAICQRLVFPLLQNVSSSI